MKLAVLINWAKKKFYYFAFVLCCGGFISAAPISNVSSENTFDRVQAGQWVVASMYWEDKLVSTGKRLRPDRMACSPQDIADRDIDPRVKSQERQID